MVLTGKAPVQVAALIPGYDVTLVPVSATPANSDIIQRFGATSSLTWTSASG